LKIKRLQGKNGCKNCGANKFNNLERHQKESCLIAHNKAVRYYMASLLTGEADNNINDEKVAAG
jgi:predicted  nucleic acid-binding Zn-ribbon protein